MFCLFIIHYRRGGKDSRGSVVDAGNAARLVFSAVTTNCGEESYEKPKALYLFVCFL